MNGCSVEKRRDWYISNTGYVLQLAAPYYEELTVRENLTLAAWIKLHISSREKFQRVEQVMEVVRPLTAPLVRWPLHTFAVYLSEQTHLKKQANTVVGGATGPGLSGGQKRRLVVALQLLKLPSVIFLDEPTSGKPRESTMFQFATWFNGNQRSGLGLFNAAAGEPEWSGRLQQNCSAHHPPARIRDIPHVPSNHIPL